MVGYLVAQALQSQQNPTSGTPPHTLWLLIKAPAVTLPAGPLGSVQHFGWSPLFEYGGSQFASFSRPYILRGNVTISGAFGYTPELDFELQPNLLQITESGSLLLQNLTLVNLPASSSQYPSGLLRSLSWFIYSSGAILNLQLQHLALVLPDDELALLNASFANNASSWLTSNEPGVQAPSSILASAPVGLVSMADSLFVESLVFSMGSMTWTNVMVVGSTFSTVIPKLTNWGGKGLRNVMVVGSTFSTVIPKLTKGGGLGPGTSDTSPFPIPYLMTVADVHPDLGQRPVWPRVLLPAFPLTWITAVPSSTFPQTFFNVSENPAFEATHFMLLSNLTTVNVGTQPQSMKSAMIISGDPMVPTSRVLDFQYFAGGATINLCTPSLSSVCYLYLKSMTLVNLPAVSYDVGSTMSNYTCLLWPFQDKFPNSFTNLQVQLRLVNVTVVLPAIELEVVRMLINDTAPPINTSALNILRSAVLNPQLTYQMLPGDIDLSILASEPQGTLPSRKLRYSTSTSSLASLPSAPASATPLPGDIVFGTFSWFGISGTNVTFTAKWPRNILAPGPAFSDPVILVYHPKPSPNPMLPPPAVPAHPHVFPARPSTSLSSWEVAVVVSVSIVVSVIIGVVVGVWWMRHRSAKKAMNEDKEGSRVRGIDRDSNFPSPVLPALALSSLAGTSSGDSSTRKGVPIVGSSSTANKVPLQNAAVTVGGQVALTAIKTTNNGSGVVDPDLDSSLLMASRSSETLVAAGALPIKRDTENLMAEIFEDEEEEGGAGVLTEQQSTSAAVVPFDSRLASSHQRSRNDPRREILRQMEELREELHDGQSQWEVHEQLGKGGFGVVYKVMADVKAEHNRKTALREAAINATLNHPNIVTTYTYDMQPLGDVQVLPLLVQVAAGLAYIHAKNIIHGDLKPDNVLLKSTSSSSSEALLSISLGTSASGTPVTVQSCVAKVADFGMSMNIRGNKTHISGVRHGTPMYIAPEILQNGKASKAADVYSFGVIMWELCHSMIAWHQYLRVSGVGAKAASNAGNRLATFHPNLFGYNDPGCGTAGSPASLHVPSSYVRLGSACVSQDPLARPTFEEVLIALKQIQADAEEAASRQTQHDAAGAGGSGGSDGGMLPSVRVAHVAVQSAAGSSPASVWGCVQEAMDLREGVKEVESVSVMPWKGTSSTTVQQPLKSVGKMICGSQVLGTSQMETAREQPPVTEDFSNQEATTKAGPSVQYRVMPVAVVGEEAVEDSEEEDLMAVHFDPDIHGGSFGEEL
ncbi:hypothetical protein CEUSTIGMA_g4569.t1 [Chlamydomonas eustigma]|uniref:Protein kinase domain-containing protein n=1 Tax=Chlamydomonas eustigma TaxID=1157962 RepID=A0A250X205_9CHLO|nr:hypothetical protein CEUSTIGMA_g4569.t1 [Chlamydomonas eustigma]|eukprot:GAX77123.1 hypothetical protein CEUSTIGMA_g4569.t1 [Chlamydomonas eustigma]